ncbi:hypothetical protein ACLOAV_006154 [Pseudogymnoascus australis]
MAEMFTCPAALGFPALLRSPAAAAAVLRPNHLGLVVGLILEFQKAREGRLVVGLILGFQLALEGRLALEAVFLLRSEDPLGPEVLLGPILPGWEVGLTWGFQMDLEVGRLLEPEFLPESEVLPESEILPEPEVPPESRLDFPVAHLLVHPPERFGPQCSGLQAAAAAPV